MLPTYSSQIPLAIKVYKTSRYAEEMGPGSNLGLHSSSGIMVNVEKTSVSSGEVRIFIIKLVERPFLVYSMESQVTTGFKFFINGPMGEVDRRLGRVSGARGLEDRILWISRTVTCEKESCVKISIPI